MSARKRPAAPVASQKMGRPRGVRTAITTPATSDPAGSADASTPTIADDTFKNLQTKRRDERAVAVTKEVGDDRDREEGRKGFTGPGERNGISKICQGAPDRKPPVPLLKIGDPRDDSSSA
jgi:hypothetical protein